VADKDVFADVGARRAWTEVQVDDSTDVSPPHAERVVLGQEVLVSDEELEEGHSSPGLCARPRRVLEDEG
jgi:hypothetical protein